MSEEAADHSAQCSCPGKQPPANDIDGIVSTTSVNPSNSYSNHGSAGWRHLDHLEILPSNENVLRLKKTKVGATHHSAPIGPQTERHSHTLRSQRPSLSRGQMGSRA